MSDVLNTLEWKAWPNDPEWLFAEIAGVVRISRRHASARYFVRALEDDGALGSWHYRDIERDRAAKIVAEAMAARKVQPEA